MIPKIKRILYTTDLSANSAYVFRYAMNTAEKHDAEMIILHVIDEISPNIKTILDREMNKNDRKDLRTRAEAKMQSRMRKIFKKELGDHTESMKRIKSVEIYSGYPAEEILRKADEEDCDVIIMGTHGKGFILHTFLGSVAERVLRRSNKPVFVIPLPKGVTDVTFRDFG